MQRRHFLHNLFLLPVGLFADWRGPTRGKDPLPPEPWNMGADVLAEWHAAARHPVLEGDNPLLGALHRAVRSGRPIRLRYHGGSASGSVRTISPGLLFTAEGFGGTYLAGYCHLRRAERVFRTDRIELLENEEGARAAV